MTRMTPIALIARLWRTWRRNRAHALARDRQRTYEAARALVRDAVRLGERRR